LTVRSPAPVSRPRPAAGIEHGRESPWDLLVQRTVVERPYWCAVAMATVVVALQWHWLALAVPPGAYVVYYVTPLWRWSHWWSLRKRVQHDWHRVATHVLPADRRGRLPRVRSVHPSDHAVELAVALPVGVVPDDLARRTDQLAHGLSVVTKHHVHGVRVLPDAVRGRCRVVVLKRDPLEPPPRGYEATTKPYELGVLETGQPFVWEPQGTAIHLLVVGPPGSGKTTLLRRLALAAADSWVVALDPKFSEMGNWPQEGRVATVACELHDIADALEYWARIMDDRQRVLAGRGLTEWKEVEEWRPVLILFDEVPSALGDTSKGAREYVGRAQVALQRLVLRGRTAGIRVCCGAQRGDAWLFSGGLLRDSLLGRMAMTGSSGDSCAMAFDDARVKDMIDGPPGTGVAWRMGPGTESPARMRVHYASQSDTIAELTSVTGWR
jgi:hypothetical protein